MDVEVLFRNIRDTRREIAILERQEDYIRLSMLPGAVRYDKDNVQSSPEDPMLKFAERISEVEELRQKRIEKMSEESVLVQQILGGMPTSTYRLVLELRYVEGGINHRYSWSEIAFEMNYSEDYVRKELHDAALEEAQEIYDKIKDPR